MFYNFAAQHPGWHRGAPVQAAAPHQAKNLIKHGNLAA
jgi:hypothetical protein